MNWKAALALVLLSPMAQATEILSLPSNPHFELRLSMSNGLLSGIGKSGVRTARTVHYRWINAEIVEAGKAHGWPLLCDISISLNTNGGAQDTLHCSRNWGTPQDDYAYVQSISFDLVRRAENSERSPFTLENIHAKNPTQTTDPAIPLLFPGWVIPSEPVVLHESATSADINADPFAFAAYLREAIRPLLDESTRTELHASIDCEMEIAVTAVNPAGRSTPVAKSPVSVLNVPKTPRSNVAPGDVILKRVLEQGGAAPTARAKKHLLRQRAMREPSSGSFPVWS